MTDTNTTIITPADPNPATNIIDYRLTQVEIAVKEGFAQHDKKLTELVGNFASNADLAATNLRVTALERVRAKNWVWNTASAAVGAALAILIGALLIRR